MIYSNFAHLKLKYQKMMLKTTFRKSRGIDFKLPYVFSAVALLIIVGCAEEVKKETQKIIKVEVMETGRSEGNSGLGRLEYSGSIVSDVAVNTSFQVSGTVLNIPVQIGDFVRKNQLIAQIDPTIYTSQYEQQRAQEQLAKENFERISKVYSKGSIAEIRMLEAKAQYEQAKAAAKMTYENVRHTKIYAPMDGYVSAKHMEAGDLAQPGQPVVEVENIQSVKAIIPIPDEEINALAKGDTATVRISALADMAIQGLVDEIAIRSNQGSPVYTAYVQLKNEDKRIKPGMACTVEFKNVTADKNGTEPTLIIPSESIAVTEDGKHFVYIAQNNQAERRYIEIGQLYDSGIAVEKGLEKGEKLIVSGYHKLTQGTPIEIVTNAK